MPKTDLPKDVQDFLATFPKTESVDAFVLDLAGTALGKRYPVAEIGKLCSGGFAFPEAVFTLDVTGDCCDPQGIGFSDGDPDGLGKMVPGSLAPVPWADEPTAQCLIDLRRVDGAPIWYDPRVVLRKVVDCLHADGWQPVTAVELEFFLIDPLRDDAGAPQPPKSPTTGRPSTVRKVYGMEKLEDFSAVLRAIDRACAAQNIPTSVVSSEFAPGQFELNLHHVDDPVTAADHACLLRRCVRAVARQHGFDATFLPKPYIDMTGSGLHAHVSVLNEAGGNIFDDANDPDETVIRQAIAGMQATMAEAMAFFSPGINGFRRFEANYCVPVTTDWGYDNRSVAFRIPAARGAAKRIEHRVAGADANPHLVLACVLAGLHHGLKNRLAVSSDPHPGNAGYKMARDIPFKIWDALDRLADAPVLGSYLGQDYLTLYRDIKQAEFNALLDAPLRREFDWYL
ncbi:MAG: glutamine synthetase family protein [Alphaproteobacteria bacterium]